jgi:hypothetical protein
MLTVEVSITSSVESHRKLGQTPSRTESVSQSDKARKRQIAKTLIGTERWRSGAGDKGKLCNGLKTYAVARRPAAPCYAILDWHIPSLEQLREILHIIEDVCSHLL